MLELISGKNRKNFKEIVATYHLEAGEEIF